MPTEERTDGVERCTVDDTPTGVKCAGEVEAKSAEEGTTPCVNPNAELGECAVCFELMDAANPLRRLSCGHGFHHSCISQWLQRNASCPLCKAVTPETSAPTSGFRIDMGHQEMMQVMTELEDIFRAVHQCAGPDHPIAIHGLSYNLCASLGYEDEDELEEAIGGSLADFLNALPHFEVRWPTEELARPVGDGAIDGAIDGAEAPEATEAAIVSSNVTSAHAVEPTSAPDVSENTPDLQDVPSTATVVVDVVPRALMRPEPEMGEISGPGTRTMFTVSEREDLWRVVLQGPNCTVEIPEMEFAIRPKAHRRVDTIYNMIAAAVFHLGDHVRKNQKYGSIGEDETNKICDTIDALNVLLDLESPFTVVLSDPQGISELKPSSGTHVGVLDPEAAA